MQRTELIRQQRAEAIHQSEQKLRQTITAEYAAESDHAEQLLLQMQELLMESEKKLGVAREQRNAAAASETTLAEQLLLAARGIHGRGGKLQPTS